ncbi:hypothetical protein AB1L30_20795 [Bremerella sp. JC817]|uniref:hypothetical protein n=1 Tax=Bremerella sp. JC817 TaxID=3231756 RepID=UPI00345B409E
MSDDYAILREADCRIDRARAAAILGRCLKQAPAEILQELHDRPGILARNISADVAREAAKGLILAGMPCRVVMEEQLVLVPATPRNTIREMEFYDDCLVFRSLEWEGRIPWDQIRLVDIVQELESITELVPSTTDDGTSDTRRAKRSIRTTRFELSVFLEIVCVDPTLRMRIDRSQFRYKSTGLKMHTSRELNFRALCIALHMRCPNALTGLGFAWISKGNNSHHQSGNTRKKFENFASWLLTMED